MPTSTGRTQAWRMKVVCPYPHAPFPHSHTARMPLSLTPTQPVCPFPSLPHTVTYKKGINLVRHVHIGLKPRLLPTAFTADCPLVRPPIRQPSAPSMCSMVRCLHSLTPYSLPLVLRCTPPTMAHNFKLTPPPPVFVRGETGKYFALPCVGNQFRPLGQVVCYCAVQPVTRALALCLSIRCRQGTQLCGPGCNSAKQKLVQTRRVDRA